MNDGENPRMSAFFRRLWRICAADDMVGQFFSELADITRKRPGDEAYLLVGLFYGIDVESLRDLWMRNLNGDMRDSQGRSDERFRLQRQILSSLKRKISGSEFDRIMKMIHSS